VYKSKTVTNTSTVPETEPEWPHVVSGGLLSHDVSDIGVLPVLLTGCGAGHKGAALGHSTGDDASDGVHGLQP
jgi:hypothetical protein